MITLINQLSNISNAIFAVLIFVGLSACMSDSEDPQDGTGEHESSPEEAPEHADEAPEKGELAAYSCAAGYHLHYVDWDATRVVPWGACDSSNGLVGYGHPICMYNTNQGYSCGGYWMVHAYSPASGWWGAIKINALNGH